MLILYSLICINVYVLLVLSNGAFHISRHYMQRLREAQEILQVELLKARKAMEVSANRRRRPTPNLIPGQKVWLLRRHIKTTRLSSKLGVRRLGPYVVIGQVGTSAYRSWYRKLYYFVDWVGYDVNERSWEPWDNLAHAQLAINDFHDRFPLKPRNPV